MLYVSFRSKVRPRTFGCGLMVEGMSIVVNVMLSLMSVMSPPHFDSVYVNLQYDGISLTFTVGFVCLCGVCSPVMVIGLSVRLSWYPMWMRWLLGL